MGNKMNDKTKKALWVGGLIVVAVGLTVGIKYSLRVPEVPETPSVVKTTEAPDVTVGNINTVESQVSEGDSSKTEDATEKEGGVETENAAPASVMPKQEIQETPVKTEKEKPAEPPTDNADQGEKESEPAKDNAAQPAPDKKEPASETSSSPKDGDIKDGNIYFEGFGWVPYEGGGVAGTSDGEMYENGNKIGVMD